MPTPVTARLGALQADGEITHDEAQWAVAPLLDQLVTELNQPIKSRWWRREKIPQVKGVYLWGGVGRGKTWLLEQAYETANIPEKGHWHFHRFMQMVHEGLADFSGKKEPLKQLAARLSQKARLLFLDEFTVTDIGDAMLLAGLLRALFDEGVTLITSSNLAPENLYKDGIQRASFLPAIDLLMQFTHVVELGGALDYRQQYLEITHVYFTPADAAADKTLAMEFAHLADEETIEAGKLKVMGRPIPFRRQSGGVIWFDYEALCGPPRSQRDYIEVARCHQSVLVSDVPVLDATNDDSARRFLFLVDEFYDRRVKLIISANALPDNLYTGERLAFEFQRTASRLREMQSSAYLGAEHRS